MSIFSFNIINFQVKEVSSLSLSLFVLFIFIILLQSPQAFGSRNSMLGGGINFFISRDVTPRIYRMIKK